MLDTQLMTIPDFLATTKMSRATLYRLWNKGEGPKIVMLGRVVRISQLALDEWIHGREKDTDGRKVVKVCKEIV